MEVGVEKMGLGVGGISSDKRQACKTILTAPVLNNLPWMLQSKCFQLQLTAVH